MTGPAAKHTPQKAFAVDVKVPNGSSYTDTVMWVKKVVNSTKLGVSISAMWKMRDDYLLL